MLLKRGVDNSRRYGLRNKYQLVGNYHFQTHIWKVKNFLNLIGEERLKNNQLRFTAVSEAFGASKEVKIGGLEETFIERFSESAKIFAVKSDPTLNCKLSKESAENFEVNFELQII